MKKLFPIFLLFAAFFIISCGGLVEANSNNNTVRFTLPSGNARAATAGGVADVSYYNVSIANQNFTNVTPGTTVESAPIPVETSITVTVEAIGKINDVSGMTIVSGNRIAYYQTTQSLPAEGLTLSINLSEYKTSYHKISFDMNNFDSRMVTASYVANGESYTPPDYGIAAPQGNTPKKHTGWNYIGSGASGNGQSLALGQGISITSDTTFTVEYVTGNQVTFGVIDQSWTLVDLDIQASIDNKTIYPYEGQDNSYYFFEGVPFILPTAKKRKETTGAPAEEVPVTLWEWASGSGAPGTPITIPNGSSFSIQTN